MEKEPDFIIIKDIREQTPWEFHYEHTVAEEIGTLKTGDYTVKGMEDKLVIERKGCIEELAGGHYTACQPSAQQGTGTSIQGVDCFTSLFFQREMVGVPYFARSYRGYGTEDTDRTIGKCQCRYGL